MGKKITVTAGNSLIFTQSIPRKVGNVAINRLIFQQIVNAEVVSSKLKSYKFLCVVSRDKSHQLVEISLPQLKELLNSC